MKKLITAFILAAALPLGLQAKAMYESEKNVQKSFTASEKNTLVVENKYGNVNITSWDKNEVDIKVTIKGKSSESQNEAERQRDRISIAFSQSGNSIIAKTEIAEMKGRSKGGYEISYDISVPRNIAFDLSNTYGGIKVDECGGVTAINVKYGSFSCRRISNPSSSLKLAYGSATIQAVNVLKAGIQYSSMKIEEADSLLLSSAYSHLSIEKANTLNITSAYDDYTVKKVTKMKISTAYTDVKLGQVSKSLTASNAYGSIKVSDVAQDAESLSFSLSYTGLSLNINPKVTYTIEASSKYGKTILPDELKLNTSAVKSERNTNSIEATVGSGTPTLKVKISNAYADNKITAK